MVLFADISHKALCPDGGFHSDIIVLIMSIINSIECFIKVHKEASHVIRVLYGCRMEFRETRVIFVKYSLFVEEDDTDLVCLASSFCESRKIHFRILEK